MNLQNNLKSKNRVYFNERFVCIDVDNWTACSRMKENVNCVKIWLSKHAKRSRNYKNGFNILFFVMQRWFYAYGSTIFISDRLPKTLVSLFKKHHDVYFAFELTCQQILRRKLQNDLQYPLCEVDYKAAERSLITFAGNCRKNRTKSIFSRFTTYEATNNFVQMYKFASFTLIDEKNHFELLQLPNFSNIKHCCFIGVDNLCVSLLKPCLKSVVIIGCVNGDKPLKNLSALLMDESCLLEDLYLEVVCVVYGYSDPNYSQFCKLIESVELNKSLRSLSIINVNHFLYNPETLHHCLLNAEKNMLKSLIVNDKLLKLLIQLNTHCNDCQYNQNVCVCRRNYFDFFCCTCNRRLYGCLKCTESMKKIQKLEKIVEFNAFVSSQDFFQFCQIFFCVNFPPYVLLEVLIWLFPTLPNIYTKEIDKKMHRFVIKRILNIFATLKKIKKN